MRPTWTKVRKDNLRAIPMKYYKFKNNTFKYKRREYLLHNAHKSKGKTKKHCQIFYEPSYYKVPKKVDHYPLVCIAESVHR